jgi:hypothetical protein
MAYLYTSSRALQMRVKVQGKGYIIFKPLQGLGQDAHVSTGDIPDMWLRDSAFEIAIYMPRMVAKPAFRLAVEGTIRRHAFDITMDPYACGFSWKWRVLPWPLSLLVCSDWYIRL